MTPEEKAQELAIKYFNRVDFNRTTSYNWSRETAKQCALMAVEEIIKEHIETENNDGKNYWLSVKEHLNTL